MAWNVLGVIVLIWVGARFELQWGRLFGLYLVWYGIGRAFLETLRLDPAELIGGVRVNIWGALFAVVLGVLIMVIQAQRHPGAEPGMYLPGKQWIPEGTVESEDDFYAVDTESQGSTSRETVPPSATSS
jgi:prolipoprotein diacylglyceryltransferase